MVFWIDPKLREQLAEDMRAGKAYPVDAEIDKDVHGVLAAKGKP
jgi:hypothetical protein